MRLAMNILRVGMPALLLALGLTQTNCQGGSAPQVRTPIIAPVSAPVAPAPPLLADQAPSTSSVMVYIKLVIDKKYGTLAHLVGGMHDKSWQRTTYDAANPWWSNPLIVYADPPFPDADTVGRADAQVMTGHGASANVAVQVTLVPHADLTMKTIPKTDAIRGTITTTISTAAEFYDGHWAEMVHETDRKVTFSFDTCDALRPMQLVGHEKKTLPAFIFERYTRDHEKWEPKSHWPGQAESGDWRVVIYGTNATLDITSYRYVQSSVAAAKR